MWVKYQSKSALSVYSIIRSGPMVKTFNMDVGELILTKYLWSPNSFFKCLAWWCWWRHSLEHGAVTKPLQRFGRISGYWYCTMSVYWGALLSRDETFTKVWPDIRFLILYWLLIHYSLTLVLMGCFLPLSLMGGGIKLLSIPFLFVNTIEIVIRLHTVLNIFFEK